METWLAGEVVEVRAAWVRAVVLRHDGGRVAVQVEGRNGPPLVVDARDEVRRAGLFAAPAAVLL